LRHGAPCIGIQVIMANYGPLEDKLVVLIGGSGFLGTHLAQELLHRGARLRIADRHPERAIRLRPLANLGQIQFHRCDVTSRASIEVAMRDADAAAYLEPLWVDDAAQAIANALADPAVHGGNTYEIAGPEPVTVLELNRAIAQAQGRKRQFIAVPDAVSAAFAMLPLTPMNSDQWKLLQRGSVPSGKLPGLKQLGVTPRPLGLFLDRWMVRYRKHGRFGDKRELA
jgi:uncharacterized protein YbjT (DUF2867 family)